MTTDELVATVIEHLLANDGMLGAIDEYVNQVDMVEAKHTSRITYSVALNNETYDVRFVTAVWCEEVDKFLGAYEVVPVTVVKTEYREK